MKILRGFIQLLIAAAGWSGYSYGSPIPLNPPYSVDCVSNALGSSICQTSLRAIDNVTVAPPPNGSYVSAAGYFSPGDLGGGLFVTGQPSSCAVVTVSGTTTLDATHDNNVVSVGSLSGISVGMSVTSSSTNTILPYDIIVAKQSGTPPTITLETSAIAAGTGTLTISPDNAGAVVMDSEAMSPHCFYRQTWQYSAKDWGAYENWNSSSRTGSDDTVALQSWLNAGQNLSTSILGVQQPHIAVPGSSAISLPLVCPSSHRDARSEPLRNFIAS